MPIERKKFESIVVDDSISTKVLSFLVDNKSKAFTSEEISEKVGIPMQKVASKLNYLKGKNQVEHKRPYWSYWKV